MTRLCLPTAVAALAEHAGIEARTVTSLVRLPYDGRLRSSSVKILVTPLCDSLHTPVMGMQSACDVIVERTNIEARAVWLRHIETTMLRSHFNEINAFCAMA